MSDDTLILHSDGRFSVAAQGACFISVMIFCPNKFRGVIFGCGAT